MTGGVDREEQVVYGIGRDVTEQRNAESQLAEAEERFRRAFDNAAIGMTIALRTRNQRATQAISRFRCTS